jgi:putative nucleotidyltransferase with HDIG domain
MLSREEALELVSLHVRNAGLIKHMIAVSSIMRGLASRLGEDPGLWELVGMLHDIDYEEVGGDMKRHGLVSAEMVSGLLPEGALRAIRSHNPLTGVKAEGEVGYRPHRGRRPIGVDSRHRPHDAREEA